MLSWLRLPTDLTGTRSPLSLAMPLLMLFITSMASSAYQVLVVPFIFILLGWGKHQQGIR